MEALIKDVLEAAGLDTSNTSTSISETWEMWLNVESDLSMETMAPLSPFVYEAFTRLFIYAWRNAIHLESGGSTSLASQVDAVQATLWLQHIMDLHVDNQEGNSFSVLLLQQPQAPELLEALYHHVSSLPYLQQQIHYRAQELRQVTSKSQSNVLTRLEQYQETQRLSEVLLKELEQHVLRLEHVLGEWYLVALPEIRKLQRQALGKLWHDFCKTAAMRPTTKRLENTSATGIHMTLRVLLRILQGSTSSTLAHKHLLFHQLLPLHQPSSMVLWRDQTSLLELYHEPLVQNMAILLTKEPNWIPLVVEALLQSDVWPPGGNTPKIVLLLHEIDTYVGLSSVEIWKPHKHIYHSLLMRLAQCSSSDNSRMAERALQFFRNVEFCNLVWDDYKQSVVILLKALVKNELPWNPTVRKMTHHVLVQLKEHDEEQFAVAAEMTFGESVIITSSLPTENTKMDESVSASSEMQTTAPAHGPPPVSSSRFSLKAGMGSWRPPRTSAPAHAQYAMGPPKARPPKASNNKNVAPPLTITGVAPWAGESELTFGHKRDAGEARLPDSKPPPPPAIAEEMDEDEEPGLKRVLDYMNELKPISAGGEDDDGTSPWAKAQMAETPTLLPSLKFHDLVFGHDLGKGAFGVVKYARQIDKSTTRSHWAEYAVKIISTAKIQEMGYEASVQREIATLRVLSHPCIARLVSSFRFGDGAYLVLEYASGGDLHSLLSKKGSLDQDSTRFVVGEVASALASIHDMGFVYADLKPENVLITETGHVKLTDFGGCRPLTEAAKELIRPSGKHLLKELRDGDWKERPKKDDDDEEMEQVSDSRVEEEDSRIEGTTAYLPPEVVMGQTPTAAADSWALGCVMYQCLSGRPPLLDNDDLATKQKIVTFHMDESHKEEESDPLFRDAHGADITPDARHLIRKLLSPREERLSMAQVAEDPFFEGTNIFALHRQAAVPLDVGTVAPVEDATWSRRQYSSIWAPQPKAYDISLPQPVHLANPLLASKAPIPEGDEANAYFSWRSRE